MPEMSSAQINLENRFLPAPLIPNSVSAVIKTQLGYVGRVLAELLYVMRCTPRVLQIRCIQSCYHKVPITINNQSLFMSLFTHLIQKCGEQVECSAVTSPTYFIDGKWIGLISHTVIQDTPNITGNGRRAKFTFQTNITLRTKRIVYPRKSCESTKNINFRDGAIGSIKYYR